MRRWVGGHWIVERQPRQCRKCGTPIPQREGRGAPFQYCDVHRPVNAHQISAWYARNRESVLDYHRQRSGYRPTRSYRCRECGAAWSGYVDDRCTPCRIKARYVPVPPKQRDCERCGTTFLTHQPKQKYCDPRCREHARSAGRGRPPSPATKRAIFERDGWRCYLCGGDIDRDARFPAARSPSIDHVKPVSGGGSSDPTNLRATHWGCNEAKGADLVGDLWIVA